MITGRWGKPSDVLLDIVVDPDGTVRGVANPGKQDAPIQRGHFDVATGTVRLEGEHAQGDGTPTPFRVEEYEAPRRTVVERDLPYHPWTNHCHTHAPVDGGIREGGTTRLRTRAGGPERTPGRIHLGAAPPG